MLSSNSIFAILQTIIVLVIVIVLANLFLKLLNKNMIRNQRIIKIIERTNVFNNSAVGIVQICGKYYLMSFTDRDNKILKELDEVEVESYLEEFKENHSLMDIKDKANLYFGMRKKS
ncbi:flagellar biosynthetic protein FliO [Tissierella sp. Yu-01]|uniref:flagellar biosynthetic protein FliO n=1 Tax=Tissierella sp. Yu-01 TaxID=3035694 RepID=UPI00240D8BB4|nr:flagellar biosynthetic protein FliO [Tissierella sp. Yu-01]WFA07888.1 flagellar biosynthetic protein FliO [Tissierella sp. Yu-01]